LKNAILHIASQLQAAYPPDEAEALAWWIAEELSGQTRTELLFGCKDTTFLRNTQTIIDRLLHFEPIQYIFGHTIWNGLELKLTPATLIPRPETAELVERINRQIANNLSPFRGTKGASVLDIGTGSGCIAIALKKAHPEWQVTGIDISPEAIAVAKENALRNNVSVNFQVADIFSDEIEETFTFHLSPFTLIVSNPPYICESEKKDMRPNVLNYEPPTALFVPDDDPLRFYRRIASLFSSLEVVKSSARSDCRWPSVELRGGVCIFFEINESYASELSAMLDGLGYTDIQITKDIYGKDRIIEGRMAL